jgi:hypothetical protein
MAQVVQVMNVAHTPFCYSGLDWWDEQRKRRPIREDMPVDPAEVNKAKHQRIQDSFALLKQKIKDANIDTLVVLGDDQKECFGFENFPTFAVYVGENYDGYTSKADARAPRDESGHVVKTPETWRTLNNNKELSVDILRGLMLKGFDPAFSMELPNPVRGMGHAFFRPAESLTDWDIPVVPILLNCYYAPQPTGNRCYELGKAIREVIEEAPTNARVAIVGSGGMWHTPSMKGAYIDEKFDLSIVDALVDGNPKLAAQLFDSYTIPEGDTSQAWREPGPQITGMPGFGGPQGGTRETCSHISAGGAVEGKKGQKIDYIPVYASPIGAAFELWENV